MGASESQRFAVLLDVGVKTVPSEASTPKVADVIGALKNAYDSGYLSDVSLRNAVQAESDTDANEEDSDFSEHESDDDERIWLIADWKVIDPFNHILVINLCDRDIADPTLLSPSKGIVRVVKKRGDEGAGYSAHLAIRLSREKSEAYQARAVLERNFGISRSGVFRFLNRLLKAYCASTEEFTFTSPKTGRERRFVPRITADVKPSHSLKKDLKKGQLTSIELVTKKPTERLDGEPLLVPRSRKIAIKVDSSMGDYFEAIAKVKAWGKEHGYESMTVRFKDSHTGRSSSPKFSTEVEDAQDVVFAQNELLSGFSKPLSQCVQSIEEQISGQLAAILNKKEFWK